MAYTSPMLELVAAGVRPTMRATALLLGLLGGCAAPSSFNPASGELTGDEVRLPARLWGGYFLAQGHVNGRGPYTFMLDTGADCMLVSPRLADQLAAHVEPARNSIRGATGDITTVERSLRIETLALGEVELRDFSALVMEVGPLARALGRHIDGVVGLPLFRDFLLTMDYPAREVRVSRGELPGIDEREILALNPDRFGEVVAGLGDDAIAIKIDSGFSREIGLPSADNLEFLYGPRPGSSIVTITGTHRQQEGRLAADLQLGHHVFRHPHAAINGGDAKLGSRLLRYFAITFDQQNHRVRFLRPDGRPLASTRRRTR